MDGPERCSGVLQDWHADDIQIAGLSATPRVFSISDDLQISFLERNDGGQEPGGEGMVPGC